MNEFKNAFKRDARSKSEKTEQRKMYWRSKTNPSNVVGSAICEEWDNATHPNEHPAFVDSERTCLDMDGGIPKYHPEDPTKWEKNFTTITYAGTVYDNKAQRQFVSAFREEVDYTDAEAAAEWLFDTFTAKYEFKGDRAPDQDDHFYRNFPYRQDTILSEMPSERELQVIQFALNKRQQIREQNGEDGIFFRTTLRLFDRCDRFSTERFINYVIEQIEGVLQTTTIEQETKTGEIEEVEVPDPEAISATQEELASRLNASVPDTQPNFSDPVSA